MSHNDASTQPRPRDAEGRELDEWGLPFTGPARLRRLRELGRPDPNVDPAAWEPGAEVPPKPKPKRAPKAKVKVAPAALAAVASTPSVEPAASPSGGPAADAALTETEHG